MNDFYEGRMIPLKIADMAIINCNKEIEKLQIENDRLKAEVERLTALVESNLNSSKVAMGKADAVLHERDSLKAEVERLRKAIMDSVEMRQRLREIEEGKPSV